MFVHIHLQNKRQMKDTVCFFFFTFKFISFKRSMLKKFYSDTHCSTIVFCLKFDVYLSRSAGGKGGFSDISSPVSFSLKVTTFHFRLGFTKSTHKILNF